MRALVFLLVLLNLLFFVWTQGYLGAPVNPDATRLQQQLLADRLTLVAHGEPPANLPKAESPSKAPEKKKPDTCLLWREVPLTDTERFEYLLSEKFPAFKTTRIKAPGNGTYWVFIPPLANKPAADKKAAELKWLGVSDFFVVQETGPNHLAISLGIFSSEPAAKQQLEALQAKGVKSARVGERGVAPSAASLEVRGPEAQADALRDAVLAQFPQITTTSCPARTP